MSKSSKKKQTKAELISLWYKKLKQSGFEDLEWLDNKTGLGQNTPHLKRSSARILQKYSAETAQHYNICSQYRQYHTFKCRRDEFCIDLYIQGIPYREIIKRARVKGTNYYYDYKGRQQLSLFSLHGIIKKYIIAAYDWNKNSPDGLNNQSEQSLLDQMNSENILYYGTGAESTKKPNEDY
jgi:hypothetical protein